MKLIFKAIIYFSWALVFDVGIFLINHIKKNSYFTSFIGRRLERISIKLKSFEEYFDRIINRAED